MIRQPEKMPVNEIVEPFLVRCPECGVRAGNQCVEILPHEDLRDLYDAEKRSKPVDEIHPGRFKRAEQYHKMGYRWPCQQENCDGWCYPINVHESISSSEHGCSECGCYISEPANIITLDEMYESMMYENPEAPEYLDKYELVDNPKAPKTGMEMAFEHNNEPLFLSRERTKPIEYNPARRAKLKEEEALCECGWNMHKWSNIVQKSCQDRSIPCYRCGGSFDDVY